MFTNGVFDILHRGHVAYLERARALGASLTVAVNGDASVRRLGKGDARPLNPLDDRMAVLAALACVDLVIPFDDDTPRALIVACMPEILVKGGDYTAATTAGAAEVIAAGGRFVAVPFEHDRSTTALVARIRARTAPGTASEPSWRTRVRARADALLIPGRGSSPARSGARP